MSSIILVAIVIAWGLVLVPFLLNRHEAATQARSVDRFTSAMRVLSRRSAGSAGGEYAVAPVHRSTAPNVVVNGATRYAPPAAAPPAPALAAQPVAPVVPAVRGGRRHLSRLACRRIVFTVLAGLALLAAGLAAAISPEFWAVQLGCDTLLAGYLWQVRRVRTAAEARRVGQREAAAPAGPSGYARAVAPPEFAVPEPALPANAVVIERQRDGSWRPVPVPLPTYITAPVAPPVPAARKETASPAAPPAQRADEPAAEVPRRLAVND